MTRAGQSPFLMVTAYGSSKIRIPVLMALIERGASPTLRDTDENTALMLLSTPDQEIVQFLIEHGVDVNAVNNAGDTALHIAARERLIDYVELLLGHSADLQLRNVKGETALLLAAQGADQALYKLLASKGGDPEVADSQGNGVLHAVVQANDEAFLKQLLDTKLDVELANHAGETPLSLAANLGHWPLATALLRKGANPNVPMRGDTSVGLYVLAHPDLGLGKLVKAKAVNIDFVTASGRTALEKGVLSGDPAQVGVALKMGADLDSLPVESVGELCAHMATDDKRQQVLELLRKKARKKAARLALDRQCLRGAIRGGDGELVGELIERGSALQNDDDATKTWQDTPIGLALSEKHYPIARHLIEANTAAGVDPHIPWSSVAVLADTLKSQPDDHEAEQTLLVLLDRKIYVSAETLQSQATLADLQWMVHAPNALLSDSAKRMHFVDPATAAALPPPLQSQLAAHTTDDDTLPTEPTAAGTPSAEDKLTFAADAKLHLIGIYRGVAPGESGPLSASKDCNGDNAACEAQLAADEADATGQVIIDIGPGKDPLILALSASRSTRWVVKNPTKRMIAGVIVSGDRAQRVDGLTHDTVLQISTQQPSVCRDCRSDDHVFVVHSRNDAGYADAVAYLTALTGRKPSRQQFRYRARQFSVR